MTPLAGFTSLYTTRAHVFQINTETKNSWLSKGDSAIPISFILSNSGTSSLPASKRDLKMIGTTDNGQLALDCVISWDTVFNKRSQKFVQWPDLTGMVYGLGFDSEHDLNDFIESFMDLRQKALSNNIPSSNVRLQPNTWDNPQQQQILSETNGRSNCDFNSSRISGTNNSAQYSNTSGYAGNNIISEQLVDNNDGFSDNIKQPPRSQSVTGLQQGKSITDGNNVARSSPDQDDDVAKNQLKYENERLKQALEESSKSASLWQSELLNLRTNNVKLTQALQESKSNVEEWERELSSLRDENKELKLRVKAIESMNGTSDSDGQKAELEKYKNYVSEIQSELRKKENEVEDLQRSMEKLEIKANILRQNGDTSSDIFNNNVEIKQNLDTISSKLDAATDGLLDVQKHVAQLINQINT